MKSYRYSESVWVKWIRYTCLLAPCFLLWAFKWDLSEVVNPTYIAAVHTLIEDNYLQREPKGSKSPHPKEHLGSYSVSFDPWRKNDQKILNRYNPFHLRDPLQSCFIGQFIRIWLH
jgi:hypothetical protein